MKIVQVGPGGMTINVSPNGKQTKSGNFTETDISQKDFLNLINTLSGGTGPAPSGDDEEDLDDEEETDCSSSADSEEFEPLPAQTFPEHLSSRFIFSVPRRPDEDENQHSLRLDRITSKVQEDLEKAYPTLSVSISYTISTLMGLNNIPQEMVTGTVTGFNTFDEYEIQVATSQILSVCSDIFSRFN